jgi:hypothetical protein
VLRPMIEIIGWRKKCVQNALLNRFLTRFNGFCTGSEAFQRLVQSVAVEYGPNSPVTMNVGDLGSI